MAMSVDELRRIAQAGKDADPGWYRVHRRVSIHLTRVALALGLAPNQVSIAMMVIGELNLMEDAAFNRPRSPSLSSRFERLGTQLVDSLGMRDTADFIGRKLNPWAEQEAAPAGSDFESIRRTMNIFSSGLNVSRVGVSYAIEISFSSPDADQAARIANATADAFVREQLQTKAAAAREGGASGHGESWPVHANFMTRAIAADMRSHARASTASRRSPCVVSR